MTRTTNTTTGKANTMNITIRAAFLGLAITSLAAVGCDDPSKGKSKATTGEAVSTTSQSAVATGAAAKYTFDQSASKVSWTGSKVTGKHEGGFNTFTGSVDVVDGAPEKSKVNVDIESGSLTTDSEKLVGHLKSPDFFDTAKFPKATFASIGFFFRLKASPSDIASKSSGSSESDWRKYSTAFASSPAITACAARNEKRVALFPPRATVSATIWAASASRLSRLR